MEISIAKAKEIREQIGATHLIMFSLGPEGDQNVATHGLAEQQAHEAAAYGNKLKKLLGWPEELCQSTPAQREEWNRKDVGRIKARIESLKAEREQHQDSLQNVGYGPHNNDEFDALYVSIRQCDFAIEQLEWVLGMDENTSDH